MNKKYIQYFMALIMVPIGVLSMILYFGNLHWIIDLLSHFRLQLAIYFLILLIISITIKSKSLSIAALLFFLVNVMPILPLYVPPSISKGNAGIVVMAANVKKDNDKYIKLINQLQRVRPDVVILEEVDQNWIDALSVLRHEYPYALLEPREDFFGLAIYSKKKLINPRVVWLDKAEHPTIVSEVNLNNKVITIIGIHPVPPFGKRNTELRNEYLEELARYVKKQEYPVLIAGDMNATSFSYPYRKFIDSTKLANCANGFGYKPTWHLAKIPVMPPLGLAIDHCFYSQSIKVFDSHTGSDIGSDHLPIINRISI